MNNLWKEWINYVLDESLRQWNDFADDRKDYTLEDFVKFTKEIALSQPPADQWIPCSERLPDIDINNPDQSVLISCWSKADDYFVQEAVV